MVVWWGGGGDKDEDDDIYDGGSGGSDADDDDGDEDGDGDNDDHGDGWYLFGFILAGGPCQGVSISLASPSRQDQGKIVVEVLSVYLFMPTGQCLTRTKISSDLWNSSSWFLTQQPAQVSNEKS